MFNAPRRMTACAVASLVMLASMRAEAQSGTNVLLVVNDASSTGETIAKLYAGRRGVPGSNVCHISTTLEETIDRQIYGVQIEAPVWRCITSQRAQDRILYIVLTKGVPIRIAGSGGRSGTVSSVDSELTLLYRRRVGQLAAIVGFVPNPYFAGTAPVSTVVPFTHEKHDIYLVTRLDGYTLEDAIGLIDRGSTSVRNGRVILDERASWSENGNTWLHQAADRLTAGGFGDRVVLDETAKVITDQSGVLGYYSWGSNDPAIRIRHFQMAFVPGALAAMFVSSDARTFKQPPAEWMPGDNNSPSGPFGGSRQSLTADLVHDGVTGTAGHVAEPYLDAAIRPDILFPAYLQGLNLAEAFYAAMPYLSWQTIVLGDPLCAPFRTHVLSEHDIDAGFDAATEMPQLFSKRFLAQLERPNPEARVAFAKATVREERGDLAGAEEALRIAIAAEPQFTVARLGLAGIEERDKRYDDAIVQYRAVLAYARNQVIALNNLAYLLAVQKGAPEEALPLAERAAAIHGNVQTFEDVLRLVERASTRNVNINVSTVLDTVAWIQHLLGRPVEAARTMRAAVAGAPADDVDLFWHAAVIFSDANDREAATLMLQNALRLNSSLLERPEVRALQQHLRGRT
jgi:uncharacterized protein (TIGR03790 family)